MTGLAPEIAAALALLRTQRADEAHAAILRYRENSPQDPAALQALSEILAALGRPDESLAALQELCTLAPSHPDAHIILAQAYAARKRYEEAAASARRACEVAPSYGPAWGTLCHTLIHLPDLRGAVEAGKRAVTLAPTSPEGYQNLSQALIVLGRPEDAMRVLAQGYQVAPHVAAILDSLLIALNASDTPKDQILEGHRRYGLAATGPTADWRLLAAKTSPEPDRPLRVAVLSGDLRTHSVSYFLRAILEHVPSDGTELIAFSTTPREDATSEQLRSRFSQWINVSSLDNRALDAAIRRERIDVVLELAGHSVGNRLQALACAPAPVIISAIGYPNTTGVPAIGYRFVDSFTDPAGEEQWATEKLVRLDPCFVCYTPPEDAPSVAPAPCAASTDAPITFASFNASQKLTMSTLKLWARVMREVPNSKLLLKSMNYTDPQARDEAARRFTAAGGDASRLECLAPAGSVRDHLLSYARADIALDPTPYAGTTTTCEALWMGVPVITLAGNTHASRVGVSLLSAAAMHQWIASSDDEYVTIAARAANDRVSLSKLRATMRERLLQSTLRDSKAYAHRFYDAIRACWREWCATQSNS